MVRFILFLGLLVLTGCAGYEALVLSTATWPDVDALHQFYHWVPRPYTEAEFRGLRLGLGGVALAGLLLAALTGRGAGRALGHELAGAWRGLAAGWRQLPGPGRRLAVGSLLGLTAVRAYFSVVSQPYDDALSFEVFVRERLLAITVCYPMPNNHILTNTLSWLFYEVNPHFWWTMRLPVLLTSTGASAGWALGLLRWSNWRVALVAVLGFGVLQVSLYHAAAGRGYWLLVGLAAVGFFAVLVLTRAPTGWGDAPAGYDRAASLGLVLAGVLGLYTVPTFAYFLVSAYSWLGVSALRRRQGAALGRAVALALLTLVGAGLLYAPLLLVSGPALLFDNEYVVPVPPGQFWRELPAYLWHSEGMLAGLRPVGAVGTLLVLAGCGVLWRRARGGTEPAGQARQLRGLGLAALWFMVLPYALVLVQRVQAPERTLFYKAQFLFVLAALLADWAWQLAAARPRYRRLRPVLLLGAGLYVLAELGLLLRYNNLRREAWLPPHRAFEWLAGQPAGPVLAPRPDIWFQLRFYAHTERIGQPWHVDYRPQPGVHYRYVVQPLGRAGEPGGPPLRGAPAFGNSWMNIYALY
ncbi:MAG: hypothetical protein ACRYFX_25470 [Janthinobacterium lividum]